VDELDFFGFDAAPKLKEKAPKPRKISVDMVPDWAGNEAASKPKKAKGSKPRRKRKLSEGALEEQRLEDEARQQASQLLAPPKTKADKRKEKRARRRSRTESMGSEAVSQQSDEEASESSESEEEAEEQDVTLFKPNGEDANEVVDGKAAKKAKKPAKKADNKNSATAEQYVKRFAAD
jgi:hypothetical protein